MAKHQKPKPVVQKGPNDSRKNGKAPKKNPKSNNHGATGRTQGGYSYDALLIREVKRNAFYHLAAGDAPILQDSSVERSN